MKQKFRVLRWFSKSDSPVGVVDVELDEEALAASAREQLETAKSVVEAFVEKHGTQLTGASTVSLFLLVLSTIRGQAQFVSTTGRVAAHKDSLAHLGGGMLSPADIETMLVSGVSNVQLEKLIPIVDMKAVRPLHGAKPDSSGASNAWQSTGKTVIAKDGSKKTLPADFSKLTLKERGTWAMDNGVAPSEITTEKLGNGLAN